MDEKIYLFKRAADGVWIYGPNPDCEHASGVCMIRPNTARTKVSIIYIAKLDGKFDRFDVPFGEFYNEAENAYASFAALKIGYTGFFTNESVIVDSSGNPIISGIANGCIDAVLSDTVDLANAGWIQPTLLAGNIKFTDVAGNVQTRPFDLKEASLMRVKRVWLTGTTADMGIVVYY